MEAFTQTPPNLRSHTYPAPVITLLLSLLTHPCVGGLSR